MLRIAVMGFLATFAGDPDYPQFPANVHVQRIREIVRRDRDHLQRVLELSGAWFDGDAGIWRGAPFWAAKYEALERAQRKIDKAWFLLDEITERPVWSSQIFRDINARALREEIGDEWFDRGIMPIPISLWAKPP